MRSQSTQVLLVDSNAEDEQLIREELALVRGSFDITVTTTLEAALERVTEGGVDVIVLDLVLPDCQGITSFLRLYPQAGDTPIIVLVGQADEDLGIHSIEKGAVDYLIKQQVVCTLLERAVRYATDRTHTLKALQASEAKFRELFENVSTGVFQSSPDGRILSANPAMVRLLGYESEEDLFGLDIASDIFMYKEDRDNWLRAIDKEGEIRSAELILRRADGRKMVAMENAHAVLDQTGKVMYYEGTITDITEAYELSKQLSYEASHDALTGLINRREFELRLERLLDTAQSDRLEHAVCYLDLDQFKVINDSCGHVAGDELLRQLGNCLLEKVRKVDTLARLGGDEFGVLLQHCSVEDATAVARELLRAVQDFQFVWANNTFTVGASIGLVPIDNNFQRITDVLGAADAACYAAKDHGRNRLHIYQEDDEEVARRHGEKQWVARVKHALTEDRFFLDVQPIIGVARSERPQRLYEILVRMQDEQGNIVPPGAFLPAVERYNLATRLDLWVIGKTLDWMSANPEQIEDIARFFINLSADTLSEVSSADAICELLMAHDLPAHKICFEITEAAAIANLSRSNQLIKKLRNRGCKFSLDDFGTGLSSFAYLKALPVDYLKIDGLYVRDIANDPVDYEVVRAINDVGHVMGKEIIAEAVESDQVLAKLEGIGVDYAQGFALGRPRTIDDLASVEFQIFEGGAA